MEIGDRVVAHTNPIHFDFNELGEKYIEGKTGTVVFVGVDSGTDQNTMVQFDNPLIYGHNGGSYGIDKNKLTHHWCCSDKYLELI